MPANFESIEEAIKAAVKAIGTASIVSCPLEPIAVSGVSANTFTAGDAFGLLMKVAVPKRGLLVSATFFNRDDEDIQYDLEIFRHLPTQIASEAAWVLSAADNPKFVTELSFVSNDDHTDTRTSQLTNIGLAYTAPEGYFWIQIVDRGGSDMASEAVNPMIQLQIQSFDPEFKER